jgi:hypothetical protein
MDVFGGGHQAELRGCEMNCVGVEVIAEFEGRNHLPKASAESMGKSRIGEGIYGDILRQTKIDTARESFKHFSSAVIFYMSLHLLSGDRGSQMLLSSDAARPGEAGHLF